MVVRLVQTHTDQNRPSKASFFIRTLDFSSVLCHHAHMTFNRDQVTSAPGSWVYDPSRTIQEKLVRWSYYVIMRQRGISYEVLGAELGVARARVQQLLWAAATSERSQLRLDAAISSITQRQHDATCDCDDPSCVVFTVTTPDNRLHQAEMGAINDWRDRINPNPEDEEEAA